MRKNKGFIFLTTIFIILFLSMTLFYISSRIFQGGELQKNRLDYIQSQYYAESLLNIFLAEDQVEDLFRKLDDHKNIGSIPLSVSIDGIDAFSIQLEKIPVHGKNKFKWGRAQVQATVQYKDITSSKIGIIQYIHPCYLSEQGIISTKDLKAEDVLELRSQFSGEYYKDFWKNIIIIQGDYRMGPMNKEIVLYEIHEMEEGDQIVKKPVKVQSIENSDFLYITETGSVTLDPDVYLHNFIHLEGGLYSEGGKTRLDSVLFIGENARLQGNFQIMGYVINLYDQPCNPVKYHPMTLREFKDILPNYYISEVLHIKNAKSQ
ncbi:MAG: hypothetical protein Q4P25_00610 [Tissierellia bacterium]|nr:hypothetical protein [Tissierellia bacterium]